MNKYKGMTYTIRKDGRLTKKVTVNGKSRYLYAKTTDDLFKQWIEITHLGYSGFVSSTDVRLKDFALNWLEINSAGKEYRTIQDYTTIINSYIIPSLGYKKIKEIKVYDVKKVLKDMENIPTTAKKTLQLIKRILNDAVDNDIILKNVALNIKAPKIIKKEKIPLTLYEDNLILQSSNKYAPFFILMRYTGMRKEEIVPLTKKDIDLKNKTISINKAVTFIHNQPVIKSTKNKKTRTVPILDIVYDMVKKLVENSNADLLFVKETDNKMLTDSAIKRHLQSFLNDLNKNTDKKINITCHQLRHSYCTMLYYSGIKIKKAQELMGHSSADMVYNIYTHLDEQREKADETINNYIKKVVNTVVKSN